MSRTERILVDRTPPKGWRGWVYHAAVNLAAGLGRCFLFWRVEGVDRIPREGPLLVIANHPTYLDPPTLVCLMIYFGKRDVSIMAWHKLFEIPLVRFFTKTYKAYPVNRDNPGRGPYVTLLKILESGGAAGVFPEGSRSEERLMGPWKPGALRAAFATKATILPITFVTVGEIWPRSRWRPGFFRRHHIVIHPPLTHEEYAKGMPEGGRAKDFQEQVAQRISDIINEPLVERGETYRRHVEQKSLAADPLRRQPDRAAERARRLADAREKITA